MKKFYSVFLSLTVLLFSQFAKAAPGNALSFDGYDDAVKITANSAFDFATGSVEAWLKPSAVFTSNRCWFANRKGGSTRYSLHMNGNTIGLWNGSSFQTVTMPFTFEASRWYHVGVVIRATSMDVFVNAQYMGSTANGMGTATGLQVQIGHIDAGTVSGEAFYGAIDEVRVWNTTLNGSIFRDGMYGEIQPGIATANGLVAYYHFDETTGTLAADATGFNRTGTLTNFAFSGISNRVESYAMVLPLVSMASQVKANSFTITWSAPFTGVAEKYYLDVSTSPNYTSFVAGYNKKDVGNVLSYNITGLANGINYYYRISAEKASVTQQGAYSTPNNMTTLVRDARTVYIDASRTSGANNGSSWANAYTRFQDGVNAAADGDSVFVAKGTYQPALNASFSLKDGVKTFGGFAGTETSLSQRILSAANASILRGNGNRVMYNNEVYDGTVLEGFTISNGYYTAWADGGAGICNIYSSPVISYCTFSFNTAENNAGGGSGGAIYNYGSSPTISNCVFNNNQSSGAGAAICNFVQSGPQIISCSFYNNYAKTNGGAIASFYGEENDHVDILNSVFSNNTAVGYGSAVYNNSVAATITNCTFANNTTNKGASGGTVAADTWGLGMNNSIIWGNNSGIIDVNSSEPYVYSCLIQGGYAAGEDILNIDPLFVNTSNAIGTDDILGTTDDGLQLKIGSPAINVGLNNSLPNYISKDVIGNTRIYNNTIDFGAYEYQPAPVPVSHLKYVDATRTGGTKTGASWANAFVKFEDAVSAAAVGDTLFVAKGTYKPATGASFTLKEGVKFYGGFAGTEATLAERNVSGANATVLSGNNARVIVNNNLSNATLFDGFTVSNGFYAAYLSGGAGMCNINASLLISHCIFTQNKTTNTDGGGTGGAMYNEASSPVITNCTFSNNDASGPGAAIFNDDASSTQIANTTFANNHTSFYGGAIGNFGDFWGLIAPVKITNCMFYGNTAGGYGGAMYSFGSSPLVTNCTFVNNTATYAGDGDGIITTEYGTTHISNSIIWGNAGGIQNINDGDATIDYSVIEGGYSGTNNVTTDPLFLKPSVPEGTDGVWGTNDDGLQLAGNSPAVNSGSNALIPAGISTDIRGNLRIVAGVVDMGSYEYLAGVLPVQLVSFNATATSTCGVALTWNSATETNSAKYVIEVSQDGRNFTAMAEVASKNAATGAAYNYNFNGAINGVFYFRLKVIDKDGVFTYSDVKNAFISCNQPQIVVAPNPVKSTLFIYNLKGNSQIQLYGVTGQRVLTVNTNNATQTIPVSKLTAGTYLVHIVCDGKIVTTEKIIKE